MNNVIENINFEKSELSLKNRINILKIPREFKKINIEISAQNFAQYSIFQGYSILPFSHYSEVE